MADPIRGFPGTEAARFAPVPLRQGAAETESQLKGSRRDAEEDPDDQGSLDGESASLGQAEWLARGHQRLLRRKDKSDGRLDERDISAGVRLREEEDVDQRVDMQPKRKSCHSVGRRLGGPDHRGEAKVTK